MYRFNLSVWTKQPFNRRQITRLASPHVCVWTHLIVPLYFESSSNQSSQSFNFTYWVMCCVDAIPNCMLHSITTLTRAGLQPQCIRRECGLSPAPLWEPSFWRRNTNFSSFYTRRLAPASNVSTRHFIAYLFTANLQRWAVPKKNMDAFLIQN